MDETALTAELLPELEALKGVEQNPYHHHDVWGHTLEVLEQLIAVEHDLQAVFGAHADAEARTGGQAGRLAPLLHDAGKPATRAVSPEGRVLFWGHDQLGATISRDVG